MAPDTAADEVLTDVPDDAPPYSDSYEWQPATAAYGVRFLSDGSVAHPWNGRTQEQRAREYLAELRATYTRDRFALVIRDAPDQPWREVDE